MILLVAGIKEGAEIARRLLQEGYALKILAANRRAREEILSKGLQDSLCDDNNAQSPEEFLASHGFEILVDASSESSSSWALLMGSLTVKPVYVRYLREELDIPPESSVTMVHSFAQAVDRVAEMKVRNVFLTTGSNDLEQFLMDPRLKDTRIIARVLPQWQIVKKCQDLGMNPQDMVAMQGPFSVKINKALFKMYNADVIVSRDSGHMGGADTKISAALELKIPLILIKRKVPTQYLSACGISQLIEIVRKMKEG